MTTDQRKGDSVRLASRRVGPDESPVSVLVQAAMDVGIDVIDRTELNDIIDPDALNLLFGPRLNGEPRYGGSAVFEAWGLLVHVTAGRVDLYPDDVSEAAVMSEWSAGTPASPPDSVSPSDTAAAPNPELDDD